jgi:exodeoxyribonuclease VII large subunit
MLQAKSQWDFGELFPVQQTRRVFSVAELTWKIRSLLEQQVGVVWVAGEITNLRVQTSGHIYFTIKDASAQLSCVLFRGEMDVDRSLLQDGRRVIVRGEVTVYEARGQYQLRALAVELEGLGALQAAFEKLKQKLLAEGLFTQERKRPLPRYPQRIGLVTSPTGAAIRDVIHVIQRRNPSLQIFLAPCRVQGPGAVEEICAALRLLNQFNDRNNGDRKATEHAATFNFQRSTFNVQPEHQSFLDLILLTRGGGSLEDLWAFNEEIVARAIFHSALPIVSAVGHEIDFTISDFVADVRAATPSAAAEIITEGVFSSCRFVADSSERMRQLLQQRVAGKRTDLLQMTQRLTRVHPRRKFNDWLQRLDDLQLSLLRCAKQGVRHHRTGWRNLSERLSRVRPGLLLKQRREVLHQEQERLRELAHHGLERFRHRVNHLVSRLRLLGPDQVLARGYSITMDAESGRVLREAKAIKSGQRLRTRLQSGEVRSVAEK